MTNDQNAQKGKNSKEELTNDLTGHERGETEKGIGVGYGKDTGSQSVDSTTAGGREGKFSEQENRGEEGLDTDWSPGASQPRS